MHRPTFEDSGAAQRNPQRRWAAMLALAGACLALAACSGGSSGGSPDSPTVAPPLNLGLLTVTVSDEFGTKVPSATVQGSLGDAKGRGTTDADGVALLVVNWPDGIATVTVASPSFIETSVPATIRSGTNNQLAVTLARSTSPAGGSLNSRSGVLGSVDATRQFLTFEVELVVVDADSQQIAELSSANFALSACKPDPANDRVECLRGPTSSGASADVGYAAEASANPKAFTIIEGAAPVPYAAALLLDQSGSIQGTDPTGARLSSAKAFLGGLGTSDRALLAAFASGPFALIPSAPLVIYEPMREQKSAPEYFPVLDSLAALVGGETPLYSSIDAVRQRLVSDTSLPPSLAKAVVTFTDGADTTCGTPAQCRATRQQTIQSAKAAGVRLFTIGLSSGVEVDALAELANQTGGAFLYAETAEQLLPLYGSVGRLLSLSLPTYRLSWTVRADAAGAFQPGSSLLGRVKVTSGKSSFDVPFLIGVP